MRSLILLSAPAMLAALPAAAADSPPAAVPASLMNKAAVVCAKVARSGRVLEVFVVRSTGNPRADGDLVDYIRQQRWPEARPGEAGRDSWQPVPVAFGKVAPPAPPAACAPPLARR